MVVCKFWLQGNCRFGDSCRNEHPVATSNRFGAFGSSSGGSGNVAAPAKDNVAGNIYNVTAAGIVKDLTEDPPSWIFSSYGPGRNAPQQLFGGAQTEQSFEELRLHHYKAAASGNPQAAINDLDMLYRQTRLQLENAVKNPAEATRFVLQAEQQHPNRLDICKNNSLPATTGEFAAGRNRGQQPQGGFGAPVQTTPASAFGQPSSAAQASANPFGASPFGAKPAFGQASGSAFGQPTQLGGGSAFGQPSKLGGVSAFGQPSQLGSAPAFGKPSQPAAASAFGQPSQLAATSAFGQPSQAGAAPAFGQPSQPGATSAFGQPSQPGATSAFGQPSQLGGGGSAFGQPSQLGGGGASAFGQPSAMGAKPNGFGAPSLGQPPAAGGFSKFAQPSGTGGSAFGQPSQPGGATGFGGASAFGKPSGLGPAPSPFAAAASANASASPFSNANTAVNTPSSATSPFGNPSAAASSSPFGQPSTNTTTNPFGRQPAAGATTNPFGQPPQPAASANPFAAAANAQSGNTAAAGGAGTPSPFGQPSAGFQQGQTPSPFGQPAAAAAPGAGVFGKPTPAPFGAAAAQPPPATNSGSARPNTAGQQHPPIESYSQRDQAGRLVTFNGQRVVYQTKDGVETPTIQRRDGKPAKIWFPAGPPPYNEDTELKSGAYTDDIKAQYSSFMNTGRFDVKLMPETPPMREWCLWNF